MMPRRWRASDIPGLLSPGQLVYVPGCAGEPWPFVEALQNQPERAAGVTFAGVWIPGVNKVDWAGLHPAARAITFFLSPELRPSFVAGRTEYRPMPYTQIYPWLEQRAEIDLAVLHLSPPDARGLCSMGIAADFSGAVLARAKRKLAYINPLMPVTQGAPQVAFSDLDDVVEEPFPLLTYDGGTPDKTLQAIAGQIAHWINDGDTLQFGLGRVQAAILGALHDRKNLSIHSGMISAPVAELIDAGAVSPRPGSITTGVALGDAALYQRVAADSRFRFAPVSFTHDVSTLRAIDRIVAINSVIEVDLCGQANAETMGGEQVSGAGGLVDFLRGARLAKQGRPITALAATARGGSLSRIVPRLGDGVPVTIARADVGIVVTEFGSADLRDLPIEKRAEALIAIAAPQFRDHLKAEWTAMRRAL